MWIPLLGEPVKMDPGRNKRLPIFGVGIENNCQSLQMRSYGNILVSLNIVNVPLWMKAGTASMRRGSVASKSTVDSVIQL